MKELKDRIMKDAVVLPDNIIKVDDFLNQQVDPELMNKVGQEFAAYFKNRPITKVLAIESSGISPAFMTAMYLNVPMIILKKKTSKLLYDDVYQTRITSFTNGTSFELTVSRKYMDESDHILLIDDILSNGETAMGAVKLIDMAGAKLEGVGILIEKSFQRGRQRLMDAGYEVYSLARILSLENGTMIME